MELAFLKPSEDRLYLDFYRRCCQTDSLCRDIMSPTLKKILRGRAEIATTAQMWPVVVKNDGRVVAGALLAIVDRLKEDLQIAYFQALPEQGEAVALLVQEAKVLAREHGARRLLVGLNLHVNYGLGLLASHFQLPQGFGSAYNPSYYIDYFAPAADETVELVSYLTDMERFDFGLSPKVMERMTRRYTVRQADFRRLPQEAELYTALNNQAFAEHRFYYQRRVAEDLELFREFRPFLREENLLFLEEAGCPIGFMLWYPDFAQLMRPNEVISWKTLLKVGLWRHKVDRYKIVEIGVIPQYRGNGAVLALFKRVRELTKGRFMECESGWILKDNKASTGFGLRWAEQEYKKYKVFLIDVD